MADEEKVVAAEETAEKPKKKDKKSEEIAKLNSELEEVRDRYMRTMAEYDNFRKRTAKEKETLYGDAENTTIASFLTVYDNLERALNTPTEDEAFYKGVEMIMNGFNETLAKLKVEVINPQGEAFDPNFHNAVMHVEDENFGENTVAEVFQKGFKRNDKVIRYAIVKVAN
ncbi:MAG: nucleotide exchange factor GrpE [Clostridia bacterium]|nr:nucleotide exchange factor GrpE [Clostridia bacterium]